MRAASRPGWRRAAADAGALCLASMLLVACGSQSPAAPAVVPANETAPAAAAKSAGSPQAAFERRQRERAVALAKQGQLGEAALAWEALTVVQPESAEYHDRLVETQRQIDTAVAERLPRAAQAYKRGELDAAAQQYLAVLALQPEQAQAAEALRAIERDRVKRNSLGKLSRYTLTRKAVADGEMTQAPPRSAGTLADRNEFEHAALLADQGEFDEAIRLLDRRVAAGAQDPAVRAQLAEVYLRKAEAIAPRDRPGAIAAAERSLQLQPRNPRAAARLREWRAAAAGAR